MANLNNPEQPGAMSVDHFARWAGVDLTTAWNEILLGRLRVIEIGVHTLVAFDDAQAWLSSSQESARRGQARTQRLQVAKLTAD